MDPTAPGDNLPQLNSDPPAAGGPNPIQPGQYVVAGADSPQAQAAPAMPQAQTQQPPPAPPPPTPPQPSTLPPIQPDPTPFPSPAPNMPPPQEPSSKMGKIKLIAAVVAVLALLGIIGGLVWFFVLGGNKPKAETTESTSEIVEDLPLPSNKPASGFGEFPQATQEASPGASTNPLLPPGL